MGADSASPLTATAVNHPPNASAMWKLCTDQDLDLPERQKESQGVTRALCKPRTAFSFMRDCSVSPLLLPTNKTVHIFHTSALP